MHHGETRDEGNLKKMRISGRGNHETNVEASTHSERHSSLLEINIKHVYASRELRKRNILVTYGESRLFI